MSYSNEWLPGAAVIGIVALLSVPSIALIVFFALLLAALAAAVVLAGAIVATPFLLGRAIRRRLLARRDADPDRAHTQPAPKPQIAALAARSGGAG